MVVVVMLMLQIVLISRFSIQVKIVIDLENSDGRKWIFIVLSTAAAWVRVSVCVCECGMCILIATFITHACAYIIIRYVMPTGTEFSWVWTVAIVFRFCSPSARSHIRPPLYLTLELDFFPIVQFVWIGNLRAFDFYTHFPVELLHFCFN